MTHASALFTAGAALGYTLLYGSLGLWSPALNVGCLSAAGIGALAFAARGRWTAGRWLLLGTMLTTVTFASALLGSDAEVHLYVVGMWILAWLIGPAEGRWESVARTVAAIVVLDVASSFPATGLVGDRIPGLIE